MSSAEKRYQVFVSSTFRDLVTERKEVMQALLELDCIPSGMELFQATDDDQWSLIKGVIDDCDYYMVIIGGRYGSIGPSGLSYTEMEYRYAVQKQKPIIGFLHENPDKLSVELCEKDPSAQAKLDEFRTLCQTRMVKYWDGAQNLGSKVSRSIVRLIKDKPATGWIRGDAISSEQANSEIIRLRQKIDELQAAAVMTSAIRPEGIDDLIQDTDVLNLEATIRYYEKDTLTTKIKRLPVSIPWDRIFNKSSPRMMDEICELELFNAVDELFAEYIGPQVEKLPDFSSRRIRSVAATKDSLQKVKIQLVALDLMKRGDKKRTASDAQTYWKLTPYGELKMMTALAARREVVIKPD